MGFILERGKIPALREYISRLFGVVWRVAMILLPWQTRWFLEGPTLGGFSWEGGRVSIYASWILMLMSILLYFFSNRPGLGSLLRGNDGRRRLLMIFVTSSFFLVSLFSSIYLRATLQWWTEVLLLMGFAWVTIRGIDRETIYRWVVYAVLPHAILGIIQFCTQWVVGSKWLGIATQDPIIPGVSVIESMGRRWLRAYGGFPHPNIFGGWLLMGLVSCIGYRVSGIKRWMLSLLASIIFSVVLALTFSRSAWVAFVILMGSVVLLLFKECRGTRRIDRSRWLLPFIAVIVFAMTVIWQWPLVVTRSSSVTRLEAISVNERRVGIENGTILFQHHPWFGVGPRATSFALVQERVVPSGDIPIVPHNVFILLLDEMGLIGCLVLILCAWRQRRWIDEVRKRNPLGSVFFLSFLIIACLDHYPWSTWSGMVWTMLVFCLIFAKKDLLDTSRDRLAMYEQRN